MGEGEAEPAAIMEAAEGERRDKMKWLFFSSTGEDGFVFKPRSQLATRRSHFFCQRAEFIVFEMARPWRVRMSAQHIN